MTITVTLFVVFMPLILGAVLVKLWVQATFYRSYFFQKQRNMGEVPEKRLREEFPFIWWLM